DITVDLISCHIKIKGVVIICQAVTKKVAIPVQTTSIRFLINSIDVKNISLILSHKPFKNGPTMSQFFTILYAANANAATKAITIPTGPINTENPAFIAVNFGANKAEKLPAFPKATTKLPKPVVSFPVQSSKGPNIFKIGPIAATIAINL